jgi:hypothetical protein
MHTNRSGDVTFKTGYANAHVTGISPFLEKRRKDSYRNSCNDYAAGRR